MKLISLSSLSQRLLRNLALGVATSSLALTVVHATPPRVNTVWYILMENRNFTENETSGGGQLYGNPAAPYINSLITPGNPNAAQVSYCTAYHHVLSVYNGTTSANSVHPSEPNYVWMESGSNLSKLDDNDPYGTGLSVKQIATFLTANPSYTGQNLSGLLQSAGLTWRAYSEGTNEVSTTGTNSNLGGAPTAVAEAPANWTVPLVSFSGTNAAYTNPYNGSHQYNFACKHTGSLFYSITNGTSSLTTANTATANPEAQFYSPLPALQSDLDAGTCAQYNVITPDQFNDMHTALNAGLTYHGTAYTGDNAQVAQGDNFLSIIVPKIMASQQYQNGGTIIIWTDETEGSNQNDFQHTLMEIVISPLAKGNAYASTLNYTHSSDINTMQKIFQVTAASPSGYLNDAANPSNATPANLVGTLTEHSATTLLSGQPATPSGYGTGQAYDLSDLFQPGVIPTSVPVVTTTPSGFTLNRRINAYTQTVTITNKLSAATTNATYLEVTHLPTGASLVSAAGTAVDGAPYVLGAPAGLAAGASVTVTLQVTASALPTDVVNATTNGTP